MNKLKMTWKNSYKIEKIVETFASCSTPLPVIFKFEQL